MQNKDKSITVGDLICEELGLSIPKHGMFYINKSDLDGYLIKNPDYENYCTPFIFITSKGTITFLDCFGQSSDDEYSLRELCDPQPDYNEFFGLRKKED